MPIPEQIRELRPHATWDVIREGIKLMLPFLAGLGMKQWTHDHATALMWTASLIVAFGIAFWDRLSPNIRGSAEASAKNPLIIIYAHWGISSTVFRDVTGIVRRHLIGGTVNIPASIGLLRDPYPGVKKTLNVSYCIARQHEISIPENEALSLQEKECEEQDRKQEQRIRARLDAMGRETTSSEVDTKIYNDLQTEFLSMPFAEKLALRTIYKSGSIDVGSLIRSIDNYGFGRNPQNEIVLPLTRRSAFVNAQNLRAIERHPLNCKAVEEFLEKWENYPF